MDAWGYTSEENRALDRAITEAYIEDSIGHHATFACCQWCRRHIAWLQKRKTELEAKIRELSE